MEAKNSHDIEIVDTHPARRGPLAAPDGKPVPRLFARHLEVWPARCLGLKKSAFSPSTLATLSDGSVLVRRRSVSICVGRFFSPDDPQFDQILAQVKRERDARIARLRRDKKKFAAAKARGRSRHLAELPRVRDLNYPPVMRRSSPRPQLRAERGSHLEICRHPGQ
jgi:hypothetical protein